VNILINEQIDLTLWNKFAENKTFFRYEWMFIIKDSYKLEPYFVLFYEDNKFALIASFKTAKGYISLPFVSYSGFLSNDENMLTSLKTYLKDKSIEIDSRDLLDKKNITSGYVDAILKIDDYKGFWKHISTNFRTQLRKSEKMGYTFSTKFDIDRFYDIYSLGMRNLGTPVHKKEYLEQIAKYFSVNIFTVLKNNKAVGTMFCINDDDTLSVLYAYVLPMYGKEYANYFQYLNAVKWMTEHNLSYLDMGRSTYGNGTFNFKNKFKPKFYTIRSKINYSSNDKLQKISKLWSKLPLFIANFIGPKIRKFLP